MGEGINEYLDINFSYSAGGGRQYTSFIKGVPILFPEELSLY